MSSRPNTVPQSGPKVIVRGFREADKPRVKDLFWRGMTEHVPKLFKTLLFRRTTFSILIIIVVMSWWFYKSVIFTLCSCLVALLLLYIQCYGAYINYITFRLNTDLKDIKKTYMDEPRNYFWIAELNGTVIGTVCVKEDEKDPMSAQLLTMSVAKGYRRLGIGNKLVDKVTDFAIQNNYSRVILETGEFMYSARRLYETKGFGLFALTEYRLLSGFIFYTAEYSLEF